MLHAAPALAPAPGPWVLGQLETQALFSLEVTLQTDLSHHYNCQFITISINLGATWEKWPAHSLLEGLPWAGCIASGVSSTGPLRARTRGSLS